MFLQNTQKLHLRHQGKLSDLIQKDRSALRKFKITFLSLRGPGKTSFFITEEFALDQTLRDGSAVHLDKRLFVTALFIDLPGKNFFAGPGLSNDQHRNIRFGNLFDLLQDKADPCVHTGAESRVFHRDRTFGFFFLIFDRSRFTGYRFIIEHRKQRITHFMAEFFDHADFFFRQRLIDIIAFDVQGSKRFSFFHERNADGIFRSSCFFPVRFRFCPAEFIVDIQLFSLGRS